MNFGSINGITLDGAKAASWVIAAAAFASAGAVRVSAVAKKTVSAQAIAVSGGSSATAAARRVQPGAAFRLSGANSALNPTLKQAGRVLATVGATGQAVVKRLVHGSSTADARAWGEANSANALGNGSVTCGAIRVLCKGNLVRPGSSVATVGSSAVAAAPKVNRYAIVYVLAAATGRAEASVKRTGESFKRLDGYVVLARASAVCTVNNTFTSVITTNGIFGTASCSASARPRVIFSARAPAVNMVTGAAIGVRTTRGAAAATAIATSGAPAVRGRFATASANARSTQNVITARSRVAGKATATAMCAFTAKSIWRAGGAARAIAGCTSVLVVPADFHRALAVGNARMAATANAKVKYMAAAGGSAEVQVPLARAGIVFRANASALARVAGFAEGFSNASVRAPDERAMVVGGDDRTMFMQFENRLLLAA